MENVIVLHEFLRMTYQQTSSPRIIQFRARWTIEGLGEDNVQYFQVYS